MAVLAFDFIQKLNKYSQKLSNDRQQRSRSSQWGQTQDSAAKGVLNPMWCFPLALAHRVALWSRTMCDCAVISVVFSNENKELSQKRMLPSTSFPLSITGTFPSCWVAVFSHMQYFIYIELWFILLLGSLHLCRYEAVIALRCETKQFHHDYLEEVVPV